MAFFKAPWIFERLRVTGLFHLLRTVIGNSTWGVDPLILVTRLGGSTTISLITVAKILSFAIGLPGSLDSTRTVLVVLPALSPDESNFTVRSADSLGRISVALTFAVVQPQDVRTLRIVDSLGACVPKLERGRGFFARTAPLRNRTRMD